MSKIPKKRDTMPEHSICITLEGPDTEEGHFLVSVFLKTVERVAGMLRCIDIKAADDKKPSFDLRVIGLSLDSPASVVLEQCLVRPEADRREMAAEQFIEVMESIESEDADFLYGYELLDRASALTAPVGKQLKTLRISTNGALYDVDPSFREHLAKKMAPEEGCYGVIKGMLEYINIHGKQHVFRIYPDVGPDKVSCVFDMAILADARAAVGQFVEVHGELKYKVVAKYPHEMKVRELKVLAGSTAANLIDARGMFPDLTGDLTTEEYIARVRGYDED